MIPTFDDPMENLAWSNRDMLRPGISHHPLTKLLQAAFEAGRGQWISVEERLPDASTTVLFYVVGEDWIEMGFYRDDEKGWQAERTLPQDETLSFAAEGVTHWMDMPAPPDSGDKKTSCT